MFAGAPALAARPALAAELARTDIRRLSMVHPRHYSAKAAKLESLDPQNASLAQTLAHLPALVDKAVRKRIRGLFPNGADAHTSVS